MDLLYLYKQISNPSNYIVDIGASFSEPTNPVHHFVSNENFKGLCIEGCKEKFNVLRSRTKFDIYNDYIYPHNILSIFEKFNVPINLDILKVDIDGFDLEVIRTILTVYKPSIIIAEMNEKIPPPILFEVKYKSDYVWDFSHLFGFSVKSGEQVMNQFGYKILQIHEVNNILCINQDILNKLTFLEKDNNIEELYKIQYKNNLKRIYDYPWNHDVNYWLEIKDTDKLKEEIINYFSNLDQRSNYTKKSKIINVDFICEISK
jgi:hypothetical protein